MFKIGDLILYSSHGICRVDDICDMTYLGTTKKCYVLHPMKDSKLTISTPVDNDKVTMLELLSRNEAEEILESFKLPGMEWIDIDNQRSEMYSDIVKKGKRKEIAMIVNSLIRKKKDMESRGKRFWEKDRRMLTSIENVLFEELAFSLNSTSEEIEKKVNEYIKVSGY